MNIKKGLGLLSCAALMSGCSTHVVTTPTTSHYMLSYDRHHHYYVVNTNEGYVAPTGTGPYYINYNGRTGECYTHTYRGTSFFDGNVSYVPVYVEGTRYHWYCYR